MGERVGGYDFGEIETKWQKFWESRKTFKAGDGGGKPKYYVLDMFPYPSAQGLHVGHPEGYTASDIVARYKRAKGFNVLHPIGWDAFGLPAEQYAIKTGTHPAKTTQDNIDNMRKQIKSLGFSYDWDRQVDTTDPKYFRWTQWIFLKFFNSYYEEKIQKARPISELEIPAQFVGDEKKKQQYIDSQRLAYEAEVPVNWCPALGTVLANEEVVGGVSERGGHPVVRKPMKQWMLRITKYAERLVDDLVEVDWPWAIRKLQQDWVGKSVGAEVDFAVDGAAENIRVFTTRPDTLFGATYMVLAPEHKIVDTIATADRKAAIEAYRAKAAMKSDLDRTDLAKEKSGEFTGAYAVNPVNGKRIPVWISDYVLISYGTGAIMAVPAHDERDFEFATKFGLEIIQVVEPPSKADQELVRQGKLCFSGDGKAVNSGQFDGLATPEFKEKIANWLEEKGLGKKAINYKLRDWLFSRQRYWGEPFPIVHLASDPTIKYALDESELPLMLPEMESFAPVLNLNSNEPTPPPLAKAIEWVNVKGTILANGKVKISEQGETAFVRELNTMPQWAGSCWYYLRYMDAANSERGWDPEKEKYWMPVDLYIGGAEHAVLHLLYSRFWHKLLYDLGYVTTKEPFKKLVNQGMILGEDGQKMSKSRGNVINPDKVITEYGGDSMRLYEMFMGPLEATKPWSMQGVEGVHRFLQKVWRAIIDEDTGEVSASVKTAQADKDTLRILHQTIKKVGDDIDTFGFNTAISQMMIFTNHLMKLENKPKDAVEKFVLVLAPFAPHVAEELWSKLGHEGTIAYEAWPKYEPELLKESVIEIPVQINGRVRDKLTVDAGASQDDIKKAALGSEKIIAMLEGKEPKKVIVVPGKLVSIVV